MKKFIIIAIILIISVIVIVKSNNLPLFKSVEQNNFVSYNGWLHVDKTSLKNCHNETFVLKGISSHGIQWYSHLITFDNLKSLKNDWGINVFRIAMYTDENGYISNKDEIKQKVVDIANNAIALDMYVIIDWHILKDNNPNLYKEDAKTFFDEISLLYKDCPNVIYEICNEPNGNDVTWDTQIKPYAEEIISVIRKNSKKCVILLGTPDWCKDLDSPSNNPLKFKNIMYSCHFYAGTHNTELQDCIDRALSKNLPIFVSEWGTTNAYGDGEVFFDNSKKWIDFLNERNISWVNWSFSNKYESSSIINCSYDNLSEDFNNYLSPSGIFVKSLFK